MLILDVQDGENDGRHNGHNLNNRAGCSLAPRRRTVHAGTVARQCLPKETFAQVSYPGGFDRHVGMSRNQRRPATVGDQARTRAIRQQCPACGRKGAQRFHTDEALFGMYCRYDDCDWTAFHLRK